MKLVIDLQGAQSASRHRGIGRYSLALAEAMARQAGGHEVWIALNGAFRDTIEPLRAAFDTLLPQERIAVWEAPTPVTEIDPANGWRRRTGEILRESFLASLKPDMMHVSSLIEGLMDNAVTSVGTFVDDRATAVTLYDLIPLIYRDLYLTDPEIETYYQRKLTSLRRADLWLAISESSRKEGIAWLNLPPEKVVNISAAADARFRPTRIGKDEAEALRRRYVLNRPFMMYTGATDPHKNLDRLLGAYGKLPAALRRDYQLLIVCPAGDKEVSAVRQEARRQGIADDEIVIAPFVPDSDLIALYNLCVVFCLPSFHEGFGFPALEAMQCGAPTIGANTSSIPEIIGRADALFDPRDEEDMAARLHHALTDADYRQSLADHGLQQARKFSWSETARRAWAAFEAHHGKIVDSGRSLTSATFTKRPRLAYVSPLPPELSGIADFSAELRERTLAALVAVDAAHDDELEWLALARALNFNMPASTPKRQLLVDITVLVQIDSKTGIQRVTRAVLKELLLNPPEGVRVEPVYVVPGKHGYRYARTFTLGFLDCPVDIVDAPVELRRGDIFMGLDLHHQGPLSQSTFYAEMRRVGVEMYFMIYDLLPIHFPHLFPDNVVELHPAWISALSVYADGVVGISRAVADEIAEWLDASGIHRLRPLRIGWFHLGADIETTHPTRGLPDRAEHLLATLASRPSFLMVGTVEPRKKHEQVLAAFEQLWARGVDTNLVIVGKQGWKTESLVKRLHHHRELGKRLFWLDGISDEYLEKIYAVSSCLIAASEGEGFGLPLIEAARHKLPILARDIPVFREVAGTYASYFNGKNGDDLACAIHDWLALFAKNKHPKSTNMPWLTWAQSTERLKAVLLDNDWHVRWLPPKKETAEK